MIFIQVGLFLRGSNDFFIGLTLSITNFFHSVFNPYSLIFILSFEDKSPISLFIIFLMIFFFLWFSISTKFYFFYCFSHLTWIYVYFYW